MIRALYSSASGMNAQELAIDTIANNLANVNTNGFKRTRIDFQDLIYQTLMTPGATSGSGTEIPTGIQVGHGSRVASTQRIFSQGEFKQTDADLDLVIEGDGFFRIQNNDGEEVYTRAGSFKLDSQGRMVTSDGLLLGDQITIPPEVTGVSISKDGIVQGTFPASTAPEELGRIQLVRFANPAGLEGIGQNMFRSSQSTGAPQTGTPDIDGYGSILQGFLELSNVKLVEEMVSMIVAQRAYEISSRSIQAADEMLNVANNLRR
ncbi:flagellar basal-body rod protein FlgG [Candidatus Poribacteria bacterium]|jgi:flagellar basal-body rod protein FlgG|nr:flagellar basal-body rod protein FlgG [Candidatus Poribacteria bacterium]MBT5531456.1 flagellar basal-body rod protein FlgG [Candidatus Poribacteria bacterium]MBT7101083.1 flagellar basal-body rod protein FlgG [Candidatus Poribacteria bacterium]MBT7804775.1 flagellar basal-body rod protein FlgG [Candidatus Poribacteria bacterium]